MILVKTAIRNDWSYDCLNEHFLICFAHQGYYSCIAFASTHIKTHVKLTHTLELSVKYYCKINVKQPVEVS